jgi:cytochrome c oxidase subunit III
MSLIARLTEKSWLPPAPGAVAADPQSYRPHANKVGLITFLGVITVLFALITSAYLMRMGIHGPAGHGGGDWVKLSEPPLLWLNTAALIASSFAFHTAMTAARAGNDKRLRTSLLAGGALGIAFLAGQIVVWRQLDTSGYVMALHMGICTGVTDPFALPTGQFRSGNPAVAFFYLITAIHGLHIVGGVAAWARTAKPIFTGSGPASTRAVTLCAAYWHFLLLIWLLMLGLLILT